MLGFFRTTKESASKALAKGAATGDFADAIRQYKRLIEQNPNDHELYNDLGFALLESGHLDAAVTSLTEATRLRDGGVEWNNLGRAHLARKDYDSAEAAFLRAKELEPSDPQPWYNLTVLLRTKGDTGHAFGELLAFSAAHPTHANSLNDLAMFAEEKGDLGRAIELLGRSIAASPDNPSPRLNLIRLLCDAGRYPESTPHLEHLAKLGAQIRVSEKDGRLTILINGEPYYNAPKIAM